jgi:hypothetical protein
MEILSELGMGTSVILYLRMVEEASFEGKTPYLSSRRL